MQRENNLWHLLKYTWIPKGNHVSDHYDAIVDLELPEHPISTNSSEMNQQNNEDDIQEEYGKMENENFMKKTLNHQEIKIHPYHQEIKIHPYHQPLNIHPYPCQGRKSNIKGITSIWPNLRIVKWKLLTKFLGK